MLFLFYFLWRVESLLYRTGEIDRDDDDVKRASRRESPPRTRKRDQKKSSTKHAHSLADQPHYRSALCRTKSSHSLSLSLQSLFRLSFSDDDDDDDDDGFDGENERRSTRCSRRKQENDD